MHWVAPSSNLLLVGVRPHIVGGIVAGEILVDGVGRTVILGLVGELGLLCRLGDILWVIDLEAVRGIRRGCLTEPVPVNSSLTHSSAGNIIRVPYSNRRGAIRIANGSACLANIAHSLLTPCRAIRVIIVCCQSTGLRRHQVEPHSALAGRITLIGAHLVAAATVVGLWCIRVGTGIGRHIRITIAGPTVLLCHRRLERASHVGLAELL